MTRERLEQIVRDESWEARVKAVHKAYDNFESRTCEHCIYRADDDWCMNTENSSLYIFQTPLDYGFGCKKWKEKGKVM